MRTKVKICGITNLEDAVNAVDLGADELGFNFYEKSPRYISPEKAVEIILDSPADITRVGVFVNESVENICELAKKTGLNKIQLHGDEGPSFVNEVVERSGLDVIKAFRIRSQMDAEDAIDFDSAFVLLDAYSPNEQGGTGESFDWSWAGNVAFLRPNSVYLAGGLSSENVGEAIRRVSPYAVDACSRLESSPGKKDRLKVAAFIKAVKEAV